MGVAYTIALRRKLSEEGETPLGDSTPARRERGGGYRAATPAVPAGIRAMSEWTVENPATMEEIEFELEKRRGEEFVFVSWGGTFQAGQRAAYLDPFQEKFGIEIIEDSDPFVVAKTRAMAMTGNITWHVVSLGQQSVWQLGQSGDLEELDRSVVDYRSFFPSVEDSVL